MDSSFNHQSIHGITDEQGVDDSVSSSSELSSDLSSDSDLFEEEGEEVNSSASSSSPPTSPSSGSSSGKIANGPLQDMSTLIQELPFKRGLSKHYNGKSQSYTSLANVRSLEDLAKPENPYNKKLKSCKSYGGLMMFEIQRSGQPNRSTTSSRLMSKKTSRGSCSSLSAKRNGNLLGSRPPIPPHRSTSTSSFANATPLYA